MAYVLLLKTNQAQNAYIHSYLKYIVLEDLYLFVLNVLEQLINPDVVSATFADIKYSCGSKTFISLSIILFAIAACQQIQFFNIIKIRVVKIHF